eukprot:comp22078_c0_seq2/m.32180 comp22078_c0_seq2/g.32180  ORF comp22078_c0_seq2/g.32180 comp22078_c0_seq2/m.32180 type:complete len:186 (-) comp22078_c0_seq2:520-1077(-)
MNVPNGLNIGLSCLALCGLVYPQATSKPLSVSLTLNFVRPQIHVKGSGVALPEEATRILRKLRTFAQNEHDLEHQANLYVQWWHAAYHTTGTDIYDSLLEDMDRKFPSPTPATSFLTMETFAAAEKKSEKSDREEETATPKRKGSRMAKNVFIHSALGPILGSDACDDGRHSGIWGKVSQHLHFV